MFGYLYKIVSLNRSGILISSEPTSSSRNELKSFWFERSRYPAAKSTRVRNSMNSYELQKLVMGFHMVASWIHARYEDLWPMHILLVMCFGKTPSEGLAPKGWRLRQSWCRSFIVEGMASDFGGIPEDSNIWMKNGNQRFSQNSKGIPRGFQDGSGCVFLF